MSHEVDTEEKVPRFSVFRAYPGDHGRPYARMHHKDMELLGIEEDSVIEVRGKRKTAAIARRITTPFATREAVHLDAILRHNAGVEPYEHVTLAKTAWRTATEVIINFQGCSSCSMKARRDLPGVLEGRPLVRGDLVKMTVLGDDHHEFMVVAVNPSGVVVFGQNTSLEITEKSAAAPQEPMSKVTYDEVGGLDDELLRVREIVELPLKRPELFERLGIDPPRGVLLHGPPGTGKTLIAKAVATESVAHFIFINGPEIMNKYYGESEATLRNIFDDAVKNTPALIFLDELDALAPKREEVRGEVEKRVVAQLLALMDGLESRGQVVVIGATNIPSALDPALRRPGRFDREISIPIPDQEARFAILRVHSRNMPLSEDVDLRELARITHGFVGADLAALCREAAMNSLRKALPELKDGENADPEFLSGLFVSMEDFLFALKDIEPTAIREVFVEVPDVGWDDIGGLKKEKELLREMVEWPLMHSELLGALDCRPHNGILIFGPPGSGKTLLAQAVAKESGVNFITIKGPELISKYVGDSEKAVRETFKKARQAAPCIVFFDDLDALTATEGGSTHDLIKRVVSQLQGEMDGVEELKDVMVLAATRNPELIDQALLRPGRFDLSLELAVPDMDARREIFEIHLRKKPLGTDVDPDRLAEISRGMSGADIAQACREAAQEVMRDAVSRGVSDPEGLYIEMETLTRAVGEVRARDAGRAAGRPERTPKIH